MDAAVKTVAVVRGAASPIIEHVMAALVDLLQPRFRLAGAIAEAHGLPERSCSAGYLRNVKTGERFSIFHDLGPGSTLCHLTGDGARAAAEAVERDIAAGCDLVVLSKFGKLEAAGEGLAAAFKAALDAELPLLTSVSPALEGAWTKFIARPFMILPPDQTEIETWWRELRRTPASGQPRQQMPVP